MENQHTMLNFACAPLDTVRIGIIGLGKRGQKAIARLKCLEGVEITALADLCEDNLDKAQEALKDKPFRPTCFTGKESGMTLCHDEAADLVYICTDWTSHTPLAVEAMKHGKHVAIEVPAAKTVDECWLLVKTATRTQRHCIMLENCCYDPFALATLRMAREGLLGEITHCEGAYIHNLQTYFREEEEGFPQTAPWMEQSCARHGGNPYPTHGIGPIAQLLDIPRTDRMLSLTSLTACGSKDVVGRVNNALILTERGRTILLQYDLSTPRPYSRLQTTCGTLGFTQKYPQPIAVLKGEADALTGERLDKMLETYKHPITVQWEAEAERTHQVNAMNFTMDARLVYCLRNGLPLDMSVYDAALWSCLSELTELSASQGGMPVAIPNFCEGRL